MAAPESALRDVEVDRLVIDWLKKRKLTESLKVLEMELQVTGQAAQAAAVEALLEEKEVPMANVVLATAGGGDPAAYATELEKLQTWVDGSLDAFRPELAHLYYAVFVHTYLQMVSLGAAAVAHAALAENKQRLLASSVSARQRKGREGELHHLLSLSSPEQLDASAMARGLRAARTPVRVSQYGYDLLLHFMRQSDLLLMLGVINQHLAVEVTPGPAVAPAALDDAGLSVGVSAAGADAGTINQTHLNLRLLSTSAMYTYESEMASAVHAAAAKAAEDENVTKKEKAARQKAAAEAKDRMDKILDRFMEPVIPLPWAVDKEAQAPALEDLRACETAGAGGKPVGPDALPSAAFLTFVNAQHTLNGAALSADATRAAACFSDSSLRIYPLDSPDTAPAVLRGHSGPVYAADWSPDDQLIVSAGADGTARLWSTKLSVGLVAFQGHMLPVWDAAFAPEKGYYFATAGADRTARLWCTERTGPLRVFAGHQADVDVVRWHPNCHYIITGSSDRSVRMWDLRTGGAVRMLTGHAAPVTALAAADDGITLASADASGAVSVWDLGSARRVAAAPRAHAGPVWSLAYSRGGGAVLATGGADCAVRLWSRPTRESEALSCDAAWVTKATPVVAASFTARNLLMCAGPLALSSRDA